MIDLKDAAALLSLPPEFIWQLHRRGIIGNPVTNEELKGLAILTAIWGKAWFLRPQLARYSEARRNELFFKPELTRVERYMLKCYLNLKEGKRLQTTDVIDLVKRYLGVTVTEQQVKKIRAMAYEIRRGRRLDPTREQE